MALNRPFAMLTILVTLGAVLTGCAHSLDYHLHDIHQKASFKVGEQWIIKPPHEINATGIEISRSIQQMVEKGMEKPAPRDQKLIIDLTNGRATLHDYDGKIYPQQIDLKDIKQLHALIAGRSWQVSRIKAERKAEVVTSYLLMIFEQELPLKAQAQWATPARGELPEALEFLTNTFDVAHRFAYPLADDVNLLK
jgi:hypothetical protein